MPELSTLSELPTLWADFHLLRPFWLLGWIPAALLFLVVRRRQDVERQWRNLIAPHLLERLLVGGDHGIRFQPIHLIVGLASLGSLAAAGPTWEREVTPFTEDKAPLVITLDLSRSMDAIDVEPTRLERAKQKIRDLLALRRGARTGLVAFAGSAHMVLPLTDDTSFFETYLMALETALMPVPGKDSSAALALAERMLERDEVPGSILFVTDGIGAEHLSALVMHAEASNDELLVLGVGTSEGGPVRAGESGFVTDAKGQRMIARLDRQGLEAVARETGAFVATVTLDDADVNRIERRIQSHLEAVREADPSARWRDFGYYLVFPAALLGLLWFRRGWTVEWQG
jgi:Ca-activated chloride channel family protein